METENKQEIQTSVSPTKKVEQPEVRTQFTFTTAVKHMLVGEKVTKLEWGNEECYGMIQDTILRLHKPDGNFYNWIISTGDIEGEDYVLVREDQ